MTNFPITPPPNLVSKWASELYGTTIAPGEAAIHIATQAARWGADQELEACCEWFVGDWADIETADKLRNARRPKPLSLKERALQAWAAVEAGTDDQTAMAVIRRALEALDD
jgi:hypothetical protein